MADGYSYSVSVASQPGSPTQICSVSNGSGTISGADVNDVQVTCVDSYTISGTVSGLDGSGLVLQNNSGDNLAISADGTFTFSTGILDGGSYDVSVYTNPTSLSQTCSVTNGSGTIALADVSDVAITCTTNSYGYYITVSGLLGSGLVLNFNDWGTLTVSSDGTNRLGTLYDGTSYFMEVKKQPTSR